MSCIIVRFIQSLTKAEDDKYVCLPLGVQYPSPGALQKSDGTKTNYLAHCVRVGLFTFKLLPEPLYKLHLQGGPKKPDCFFKVRNSRTVKTEQFDI